MNIHQNNKDLIKGMKPAMDVIRSTYGPAGMNVVIQCELYPGHMVANDAETVIQALHAEDPYENVGLDLLKELSAKADKDSGDGRKTTLIVADVLLKSGMDSMYDKRELDAHIEEIEAHIDAMTVPITIEDVHSVAAIAGESQQIGNLVGGIYKVIGKDGLIIVEGSGTWNTSFDYINGVRFQDTGYLSPYMAHDETTKKPVKAIYDRPAILVTKRKITHLNDINPLIEALNRQGKKDLVIFTDDMDSGVASVMIKAHQDGIMNILIIKAPVLWKNYVFDDFAAVTGATILEDATGINFKNVQMSHLGTCERIIVDRDETVVIGGSDISDHIKMLKKEGTDDAKLRVSWLATKTAVIKLGANNESELSYLRLKCHDAINSSRLALRSGVVPGGGKCLAEVAKKYPKDSLMREALMEPLYQNLLNMGKTKPDWGNNIVDAAAVVKNAVRNAIALASTVITCGAVVILPPKSAEQIAAEVLQRKGIRL